MSKDVSAQTSDPLQEQQDERKERRNEIMYQIFRWSFFAFIMILSLIACCSRKRSSCYNYDTDDFWDRVDHPRY